MPPARWLTVLLVTTSLAAAAENGRPREYWTAIASSDYTVPVGAQPYDLLVEMNELLASPDPVLRDEVAYGAAKLLEALGGMR